MKLLPLLALLAAPLCIAQQESPAPQQTEQTPFTVADPQLRQVLQDAVRAMTSVTELLESVHDKATADAVADKLKIRNALLDELSFGLQYIPYPVVMHAMSANGITQERTEGIQKRLEENRFYGSTALAKAMGAPAYMAMEIAEPTAEDLEAIARQLKAAATRMPQVSGGPGLSKETAWVLTPELQDFPDLVQQSLTNAERQGQRIVHDENGDIYLRVTLLLTREDKAMVIELWFKVNIPADTQDDATPTDNTPEADDEEVVEAPTPVDAEDDEAPEEEEFNPEDMEITVEAGGGTAEEDPTVTPEQQAEALKVFVESWSALVTALNSISDTASADAAVPAIEAARARLQSVSDILRLVPGMDIIEAIENSGNPTPAGMEQLEQRLEANDFYGSAALKRALLQ
ncbi:MAG: hypothetical protein IJY72_05205 [Akkermansia sp.]|nr:hypothetical protein [Akkermansia sp.]